MQFVPGGPASARKRSNGASAYRFAPREKVKAAVRRSSSQGTWRQVVGALAMHPVPEENRRRPTDFPRAVEQLLAGVTNRCVVAIISDFFIGLEDLKLGLSRLKHAGHDAIAFQILDKQETLFDFVEAAPFEGLEGEATLRIDPRALRKASKTAAASIKSGGAGFSGLVQVGPGYSASPILDWANALAVIIVKIAHAKNLFISVSSVISLSWGRRPAA